MRALFLLFIIVPITEMWLLIEVGDVIGAISTVTLVFLTAIIGAYLLRRQGLDTLLRVNQRLARGELPVSEVLEGVVLAMGGALLLTPGFITDTFGFMCLLPGLRQLLGRWVIKRGVLKRMGSASFSHWQGAPGTTPGEKHTGEHADTEGKPGTTVIDGEFRREE